MEGRSVYGCSALANKVQAADIYCARRPLCLCDEAPPLLGAQLAALSLFALQTLLANELVFLLALRKSHLRNAVVAANNKG